MANTFEQTSGTTREFTLEFLKQITDDFSEEHVIGRGAFGIVYKGVLEDGEEIALKKFHYLPGLDDTQFRNEFNNLMRAQHLNIARLVGYCYYQGHQRIKYNGEYIFGHVEERFLCFEYLQGGSLDKHISDESCGLDWHTRFKIIRGVSEGLNYLHNGYKDPIYHLDLKPENILLDKNMVPKIGDFGLSRLFPSAQTCITSKIMGTVGYMPPEYIDRHEITSKFDIFSLGVIIIRIVAGYEGYSKCASMSSQGFIVHVHENWGQRLQETISLQTSEQVKSCIEIALRCVEADRVKRPTITEIVDKLNKLDLTKSSRIGQNIEMPEHTTIGKQDEIQEQITKSTKEQVNISCRRERNILTRVTMDVQMSAGVSDAISSMHYRRIGSQEQDTQYGVLHLQSDLQRLRDTLPTMYNLIDGAEWRSHKPCVVRFLPKLKDAVYDADDLLDEFGWHERNVELEGNATKTPFDEFFGTVLQGSFNKLKDVQGRLDHLCSQLEKIGLREVTQRFDKAVRPETSSLPNEANIFGREKELKDVMKLLSVPTNSKRKRATSPFSLSTCASLSNQVSNESRMITCVPVLPIVGIGGVGKTTLAQHICNHKQVKSHFELVIWICVSDNFDVKRLTKEVIESCPENMRRPDNLDSLQRALSNQVNNKRLLIVLDDMWDDALKENGQCWKRFCAPLLSAKEGSMMLVTTRCPKVAEGVGTMESVILEGLNDDVFWNFFKLCVFGSESSDNDPELERIGRSILSKLKGSPLAAKTLGRMLRMELQASSWNAILDSELWKLPQEVTEILPALQLSYMYLPFRLKRCFSFCAVYPKDYKFRKEDLAEIWVAEGFVEPQGDEPIQVTGYRYFEDLLTRSFFQKVNGQYVIHDLLHDMAQKVSEHECFIVRNKNDFNKVPQNVRHICVLPNSAVVSSDLLSLCNYKKLRTLICLKQLRDKLSSVMKKWCTKLRHIRVISCVSTNELPDSMGNLKHLRYLKISEACPVSIPFTFSWLYNLQILDVKTCKIRSLPDNFGNLSNLKRFVAKGFLYNPAPSYHIDAAQQVQGFRLMKNLNQFSGELSISNVQMLSKDDATEAKLTNKKYLKMLSLKWSISDDSQVTQHNAIEVLQGLQPPMSLRSLLLENYPGVSLPSWFQAQMIDLNDLPPEINDNIAIFVCLTYLEIIWCENLSSLEHFVHPDYVPAIKKICLQNCKSLVSIPVKRFKDFSFLEELEVYHCRNIRSQSLVSPSLKRLKLGDCGSLLDNIDCCSLTNFTIFSDPATSIQIEGWSLPSLENLEISYCRSLTSIGVSNRLPPFVDNGSIRVFPKLSYLKIEECDKLSIVDGLLTQEYLPSIERIHVSHCAELVSLPGEKFGSFRSLKYLYLNQCSCLNWQSGLVLPSSLQTLHLSSCGDFSTCVPGCLENLTSLLSLMIVKCEGLTSIPRTIWHDNLPLLEELIIRDCPNLVSVGGAEAVANIKKVEIIQCRKLKGAKEIMRRG